MFLHLGRRSGDRTVGIRYDCRIETRCRISLPTRSDVIHFLPQRSGLSLPLEMAQSACPTGRRDLGRRIMDRAALNVRRCTFGADRKRNRN